MQVTRSGNKTYIHIGPIEVQYGHLSRSIVVWLHGLRKRPIVVWEPSCA